LDFKPSCWIHIPIFSSSSQLREEIGSAADASIGDADDFAHEGGESEAFGFSSADECVVEVCERIFAASGGEGGDEEGGPDLPSSA